jgi:hypothetical protein
MGMSWCRQRAARGRCRHMSAPSSCHRCLFDQFTWDGMLWCFIVHAVITIALVADTGDGDCVTLCDHWIVTGSVAEPMHNQATCCSACIPPVLRGVCTRWVHCSGENFSKLRFRVELFSLLHQQLLWHVLMAP